MRFSGILLLLLMLTWSGFSQSNRKVDSLEQLLPRLKPTDTTLVNVLRKLSTQYQNINARKCIQYAQMAVKYSSQLNNEMLMIKSYVRLGVGYGIQGNFDSSMLAFEQQKRLAEKRKDFTWMSHAYTNIGITYSFMANYEASLKSFYKSLEAAEKLGISKSNAYGNIASAYRGLHNFKMALQYDSLAIREGEAHHVPEEEKNLLMGNMAESLTHLKRLTEAKKILERCIDFSKRKGEKFYLSNNYLMLADIYKIERNYDLAFENISEALKLKKEMRNWHNVAEGYEKLAQIEFLRKKINSSKTFALRSIELSDSLRLLNSKYNTSQLLSKIALYERNLPLANYYDSLGSVLKDSINLQEQSKAVAELKTKYETVKKEKENEILKVTHSQQEAELSVQRYAIVMIGVILMAVLVLLFVVYRSRQLFKKTNALLKRKNYEIQVQREEIMSQKEQIGSQMGELKKTQSQLIQSEKMASLGQMTSGIAHEINNPLNFISGGVEGLTYSIKELVRLAKNPEEIRKTNVKEIEDETNTLIGNISNGVSRANRIVKSLRTFASPQGSSFTAVNVVDTLEMAITMLNNKITENNIELFRTYSEHIKSVTGNASELTQVFSNIIDNAIQSMEDISKKKELRITISTNEDFVTIGIRDTGRGIPDSIRDKIMEPFFTTKPVGRGTGLGLSISYNIIEQHKGRLTFASEEGIGTVFTITLKAS